MRNVTLLILFSLVFTACKKSTDNYKIEKEITQIKFPTLLGIDSIECGSCPFAKKNETLITTAYYKYNYIGKLTDSIKLANKVLFNSVPPKIVLSKKSESDREEERLNKYLWDADKELWYVSSKDTLMEILIKPSISHNNSYPVLIRNINKDTVSIGHSVSLPLIIEAKDKMGKWQPIQNEFHVMCGLGVENIILPPNEVVITLAPIFQGDYKTLLRLSLGKNKSKPYWGMINYSQFNLE